MIIENFETLTSHGNTNGRKTVLEIFEAGLAASDPYGNVRKMIRIQNGKLIVGHRDFSRPPGLEPLIFDLSESMNIYVVGGGKAAQRQAKAIEDVLGNLITDGQINAKKGEELQLKRIKVTFAGHPIPDEDSVRGTTRILEIMKSARKGDILFFSESGGGSALYALPVPSITLENLQEVTRLLYFECGASMPDTNAVRTQLMVLRGKEGRYVGDATFIGIHTAETPPNKPGMLFHVRRSGPASYQSAIKTLKRYEIWVKVPQSVRTYLEKADPEYGPIRPGELDGKPQYHFRVMGSECMLEAAVKRSEELGLNTYVASSSLNDIEDRQVGEIFAYMAQEVEVYGRPAKPPCVLICGGELLVTLGKATGKGGRNQEFALSTAPRIDGSKDIVVASIDSDGTDGPTDAAGGIVDGYTMARAKEAGLDVFYELDNHNSYEALRKLGDNIYTGARGTNVRDLRIAFVGKPS